MNNKTIDKRQQTKDNRHETQDVKLKKRGGKHKVLKILNRISFPPTFFINNDNI